MEWRHEVWAEALWVEQNKGDDGPSFMADQITRWLRMATMQASRARSASPQPSMTCVQGARSEFCPFDQFWVDGSPWTGPVYDWSGGQIGMGGTVS
jgi:hypothetical protein